MKNIELQKDYESYKLKALNMYKRGNMSLTKLSNDLKLDRSTVTKWVKDEGLEIKLNNKNKLNSLIFNKINTPEKAYWLGFLYADGAMTKNNSIELCLKLSDKIHLVKFKNFLSFEGELIEDSYRCRLVFRDKDMFKRLNELGCTIRKSFTLKFPTSKQVPKHLHNHFIRGYFDGDGHITAIKNPTLVSLIGTKDMLSKIVESVELPAKANIRNCRDSKGTFVLTLSGINARNFLSTCYKGSSIHLDRKYELYLQHKEKIDKRCSTYETIKKFQWNLE